MWEKSLWFKIVYNKDNIPEKVNDEKEIESAMFQDYLRKNFAELINQMDGLRNDSESPDQKRLCSIAISKLEEACMFCVKAVTYDM